MRAGLMTDAQNADLAGAHLRLDLLPRTAFEFSSAQEPRLLAAVPQVAAFSKAYLSSA